MQKRDFRTFYETIKEEKPISVGGLTPKQAMGNAPALHVQDGARPSSSRAVVRALMSEVPAPISRSLASRISFST